MKKQKRDRHSLKFDRDRNNWEMSERPAAEHAKNQMRHKPYSAILVSEQGRQMEHKTVDEYLRGLSKKVPCGNRAFLEKNF